MKETNRKTIAKKRNNNNNKKLLHFFRFWFFSVSVVGENGIGMERNGKECFALLFFWIRSEKVNLNFIRKGQV